MTALGPVDLVVGPDEIVVVLGPSGCGKTTMLRLMAGLIAPTSGEVRTTGDAVGHAGPPQVGVVFQDANLLPWLTVEENVALPLRLRGVTRDERLGRAQELCRLVGIGGFERHWPRELSTGMRQRAATGRALCGDPDVLLLDEPFAALDALTRDQLNLELQRIWLARRRATLLVTHSIAEAVFLGDKVVSLSPRPGRVVGVTDVAFPRPRNLDLQASPEFQAIASDLRHAMEAAA